MTRAFIAVGSNIGPAENVRRSLRLLAEKTRIKGISTVYRTAPEGRPEQSSYYNCVVEIDTEIPPLELKQRILRKIEEKLERRRSEDKYAARTIDLDLIIYDELVLETENLRVPDRDIRDRPYLAAGLDELAPGLVIPGWQIPVQQMMKPLPTSKMEPLNDYTEDLRKEILYGFQHGKG